MEDFSQAEEKTLPLHQSTDIAIDMLRSIIVPDWQNLQSIGIQIKNV